MSVHKLNKLAAEATSERMVSAHLIGGAHGYVMRGKEIPTRFLPGRFIMRQPADVRASLVRLTSDDHLRTADWAVRNLIG